MKCLYFHRYHIIYTVGLLRKSCLQVWMAEQKAESYKKKQEELRVQYEKEQDLYTNKYVFDLVFIRSKLFHSHTLCDR